MASPLFSMASSSSTHSVTVATGFTLPSSSPTQTGGPGSVGYGGPNISTSSSMYLYTFLATLLILLGVSSAIVLRSIVLRRRQRRMIETAIADGTWIPPRTRQRRTGRSKTLGEKPKMFVAAFGKEELAGDVDGVGKEKMREEEKVENVQWKDILPVSASYITPPTDMTPPAIPNDPQLASTIPHTSPTPTPAPTPSPPSTNSPSPEPKAPLHHSQLVRISVLIAMPSRNPITTDQEDLPPMEIGVAELHFTGKTVEVDADDDDDVCN